jgi:Protein of unknown function (DUF1592)/Protein of unknown function (DUF1588)/Protein of unknown function (DUF1585)/Protein of unknown function (DUF1587)/Protein of unknown function (DUF1595)/Ca-dependent carbohydrate-binding module xylan-binding/Planctomycete cytochrome C
MFYFARLQRFSAVVLGMFILWGTPQLSCAQPAHGQALIDQIQPLLKKHCIDCHSGAEPDAGVTLEHFEKPVDYLKSRKLWDRAIQKVQLGEMPPADSGSMSDQERRQFQQLVTDAISDFECGLTPNPGQVTLRRLNATEYRNTIKELFKIDYAAASSFPGDDVGYGFDNIGDVLTLPPLLLEKYFLAAEEISRQVFATPPAGETYLSQMAGSELKGDGRGSSYRTLASEGTAWWTDQTPWGGPFQLKLTLSGDQAGGEPVRVAVLVDEKLIQNLTVANEAKQPKVFDIDLRLKKGNVKIAVKFLNDFYQPAKDGKPQLDRNLHVHHTELTSSRASKEKLDPTSLTSLHRQLLEIKEKKRDDQAVLKEMLQMLGSRAYRRPLEPEQLSSLVELATQVLKDEGTLEEAMQVGLQALLISPNFLYRVEPPRGDSSQGSYTQLDEFELASRLSYFLWSSTPDSQLLALAWSGKLRQDNNLEKQIARMIKDTRANEFVENFAGQWLTLRKLNNFTPNSDQFPKWNDDIRKLVERETLTFFAGVMRKNLSVLELLDGQFTYLNEPLARYYDIPGVKGDEFREVSLKGTGRAGLLTQASILAVTSNPTRTSPVKRGKWILDNLLGKSPPPAPPGVPELEKVKLSGTLRQRLEQHRLDPACANCHKLMDPIGFALENFDAIGRYRTQDQNQPIDSTGELPDGTLVRNAQELRAVLSSKHRDDFVQCLTEKMLTYALGRGLEYYDKCAVDKIMGELKQDNYRFSTLLTEIINSDPFQKKGSRENP